MALKLGTIFAEARLDTQGFRKGTSEIQGMVGTINTSLGSISGFGAGAAIAVGVASAIDALAKIPQSALKINADLEQVGIGIQTALQDAAANVPPSYETMAAAISQAVEKEAKKVEQVAQDMADAVEDHALAAARSIKAIADAGADRGRSEATQARSFGRSQEDSQIEALQRLEDAQRDAQRSAEQYAKTTENLQIQHGRAIRNALQQQAQAEQDYAQTVADAREAASKASADAARQHSQAVEDSTREASRLNDDFAHDLEERNHDFEQADQDLVEGHTKALRDIADDADAIIKKSTEDIQRFPIQVSQQLSQIMRDQASAIADFSRKMDDIVTQQANNAIAKFEEVRIAHERAQQDFREAIQDQNQRLLDQNQDIDANLQERLAAANQIGQEQKQLTVEQQRQKAIADAQADAEKARAKLARDVAREQQRINEQAQREAEDFGRRQQAQMAEDAAKAGRDAQERIRLQQTHALELQNLSARTEAIKGQADAEIQQRKKADDAAAKQLKKRLDDENKQYAKQSARLAEKYDRDNANAARSYNRRAEDLERSIRREQEAYRRQQQEIADQLAKQEQRAQEALDKQVRAVQQAIADENQDYERNSGAASQQRQRETEDITRQFKRQEEAAARRTARELEDNDNALTEIARRYDETISKINEEWEDEARRFARQQRKQVDDAAEAQDDLTKAIKKATDQQESTTKPFQLRFTQGWVDAANQLQQITNRPFRFTYTDDTVNQREQLLQWIDEMNKDLPGTLKDAQSSMMKLLQFGIDPLMHGTDGARITILELASALATKPGVAGGIDQVTQAFGALATGQMGEAVQRFREMGIQIDALPGVIKSANGEIQNSAKEMFQIILKNMGPDAQRLLDNYRGSWAFLTSNLEDAKDRILRAIGKGLFEQSKAALTDFISFLDTNSANIDSVTSIISKSLGDFVNGVVGFMKQLFTPEALKSIGDFVGSLGELRDAVGGLEQQFERGLFGGATLAERIFGTGEAAVENRATRVNAAIDALSTGSVDAAREQFSQLGINVDYIGNVFDALATGDVTKLITGFSQLGLSTQGIIDSNGNLTVSADEAASAMIDGLKSMQGPASETDNQFKNLVDDATKFVKWLKDIAESEDARQMIKDLGTHIGEFFQWLQKAVSEGENLQVTFDKFSQSEGWKAIQNTAPTFLRIVEAVAKLINDIVEFKRLTDDIAAKGGVAGIIGGRLFGFANDDSGRAVVQRLEESAAATDAQREALDLLAPSADTVSQAVRTMNSQIDVNARNAQNAADVLHGLPPELKNIESAAADTEPALRGMNGALNDWSQDVNDILGSTFDDLPDRIRPAMQEFKDTVNEGLHEIHGSGIIGPWIEQTHEFLVEGIKQMFGDAGAASEGFADAIGDQLAAASVEVSLFVDALDEASTQVVDDLRQMRNATDSNLASLPGGADATRGLNIPNWEEEQRRQDQANWDAINKQAAADMARRQAEAERQQKEAERKAQEERDNALRRSQDMLFSKDGTGAIQQATQLQNDTINQLTDAQRTTTDGAKDAAAETKQASDSSTQAATAWADVFNQLQRSEFLGGTNVKDLSPEAKAAIDAAIATAAAPTDTATDPSNKLNTAADKLSDAADSLSTQSIADTGAAARTSMQSIGTVNIYDAGQGTLATFVDQLNDAMTV